MEEATSVDIETQRRIAQNESRFRAANERIEGAAARAELDAAQVPFVCECGRVDCLEIVRLEIADYESARQQPTYFVCAPGHAITTGGMGRIVVEGEGFVIMEKLGAAGEVARAADPRASRRQTGAA